MKPWQTVLEVFADFPWRCVAKKWDITQLEDPIFADDPEGSDCAFFCEYYNYHRIIPAECLGDSCPCCKLAGHDEYISRLKE